MTRRRQEGTDARIGRIAWPVICLVAPAGGVGFACNWTPDGLLIPNETNGICGISSPQVVTPVGTMERASLLQRTRVSVDNWWFCATGIMTSLTMY